jgi:hypothetical protein
MLAVIDRMMVASVGLLLAINRVMPPIVAMIHGIG